MTEKITAADAIRLLDTGKAVAVDVREPDEYAVGHIPGAKLLPLGQVIDRAAEVLPDKNALWLVYCRTGRRSADEEPEAEAGPSFTEIELDVVPEPRRGAATELLAQTKRLDDRAVPLNVLVAKVIEQIAALSDELQQAAAAGEVLLMGLEMPRQVVDAFREERNLHLRRTRVGLVGTVLGNDFCG